MSDYKVWVNIIAYVSQAPTFDEAKDKVMNHLNSCLKDSPQVRIEKAAAVNIRFEGDEGKR